jgi:DNA polymerase III delta prime subunit
MIAKNDNDEKHKIEMSEKLKEIETDLKSKVQINRKKLYRKLFLLKLAHERKKNKYRQQIMDIKRTLTQNMLNADKLGDENKCISAFESKTIEAYCSDAFLIDPISLADCKKEENFCYICCENEFGDMHQLERERCVNSCEKKETLNKLKDIDCGKNWLNITKLKDIK